MGSAETTTGHGCNANHSADVIHSQRDRTPTRLSRCVENSACWRNRTAVGVYWAVLIEESPCSERFLHCFTLKCGEQLNRSAAPNRCWSTLCVSSFDHATPAALPEFRAPSPDRCPNFGRGPQPDARISGTTKRSDGSSLCNIHTY